VETVLNIIVLIFMSFEFYYILVEISDRL